MARPRQVNRGARGLELQSSGWYAEFQLPVDAIIDAR